MREPAFAQQVLELGKSLFYRVEVRRAGRQVDPLIAPLLDQFRDSVSFVKEKLSITITSSGHSVGAKPYLRTPRISRQWLDPLLPGTAPCPRALR